MCDCKKVRSLKKFQFGEELPNNLQPQQSAFYAPPSDIPAAPTQEAPHYQVGPVMSRTGTIKSNKGQYEMAAPFQYLNQALLGANMIMGEVNDARTERQEQERYIQMIQPKPYANFNEAGISNVPVYMQKGGKLREPIYVEDPNDPRLRKYNDSMQVHTQARKFATNIEKGYDSYYKTNGRSLRDFNTTYDGGKVDSYQRLVTPADYEKNLRSFDSKLGNYKYDPNYEIETFKNHGYGNSNLPATIKNNMQALKELEKKGMKPYRIFEQAESPDYPVYKKPVQPVKLGRKKLPVDFINMNSPLQGEAQIQGDFQNPVDVPNASTFNSGEGSPIYADVADGGRLLGMQLNDGTFRAHPDAGEIDPSYMQQMIKKNFGTDYKPAEFKKGGTLTAEKAGAILGNGKVYGKKLTAKQRKHFEGVAKKQVGGEVDVQMQGEESAPIETAPQLQVGQEVELTIQEIKELQAQGYQFDLLD